MTSSSNLPNAELVVLPAQNTLKQPSHQQGTGKSERKGESPLAPTDLRERWVVQFFESRSLAPNTKRAYQRTLTRFMQWTPKPWADVTRRDIAHYKGWLQEQLTPKGKPQFSPASINQSSARSKASLGGCWKWN